MNYEKWPNFVDYRPLEYVATSELFWRNPDLVGHFCNINQCHSWNWMDWHIVTIIYNTDYFISIGHTVARKIIRRKVQTVCIAVQLIGNLIIILLWFIRFLFGLSSKTVIRNIVNIRNQHRRWYQSHRQFMLKYHQHWSSFCAVNSLGTIRSI